MRTTKVVSILGVALAAAACGAATTDDADSTIVIEAEAPYARPEVTPSAHVVSSTAPGAADMEDEPPAREARIEAPTPPKVANVTTPNSLSANTQLKRVALGDDILKSKPSAGSAAFFGLGGDAERGAELFAACAECHALTPGANGVGPSLYAVVGRRAGAIAEYQYSDIYGEIDVVWTEDALFGYLENPQNYILGTRTEFEGMPDAADRADIIAFLTEQGP